MSTVVDISALRADTLKTQIVRKVIGQISLESNQRF